jgi:hypothetical protein
LTSEAFWDNHPAYRHLSEVEQFLPSLDEIDASKRDFERLLASLSDAEKEALLSGQTQVPTNMLLNDSTLHALLHVIQIRCPTCNLAAYIRMTRALRHDIQIRCPKRNLAAYCTSAWLEQISQQWRNGLDYVGVDFGGPTWVAFANLIVVCIVCLISEQLPTSCQLRRTPSKVMRLQGI